MRVDRPLGGRLRFGALAAYDDVGSLDPQYDSLEGAKRLVRLTLTQPVTRGASDARCSACATARRLRPLTAAVPRCRWSC